MKLLAKLWRWLWPTVTHEWCVVGNTIGRHRWGVELCKCKNGTPVGAGWFLAYIECENEKDAREVCEQLRRGAEEHNARLDKVGI